MKTGKKRTRKIYWELCFILILLLQSIPTAAQGNNGTIAFDNQYIGPTMTPTTGPVTENFKIRQNVTGSESGTTQKFTFVLEGLNGAPMPKQSSGQKAESVIIGSGTADFGEVTFTTADVGKVYSYTVKEVPGRDTGIIYDRKTHRIQVAITLEDYKLVPTIIVDGSIGNHEMVFTNKTSGESEPEPGMLTIYEIFGEKEMPNTGFPTEK